MRHPGTLSMTKLAATSAFPLPTSFIRNRNWQFKILMTITSRPETPQAKFQPLSRLTDTMHVGDSWKCEILWKQDGNAVLPVLFKLPPDSLTFKDFATLWMTRIFGNFPVSFPKCDGRERMFRHASQRLPLSCDMVSLWVRPGHYHQSLCGVFNVHPSSDLHSSYGLCRASICRAMFFFDTRSQHIKVLQNVIELH